MSAPRVSIVIPAYNAEAFLERTIETVAAQTFTDFELIVVDDGSRDATYDVASGFIKSRGFAGKAVKQANKMIAGARNTGVELARGEFVAFLDHDDLWLPQKLQTVMAEFDKHPEADLVCHDEDIIKDGTVVRTARNGPWVDNMYERLLFTGNALSPSAVTVRRSKVLEVGGFREGPDFNTVEDYDLWMRLSRICSFRFIPEVLGRYQLVESAASNKVVYHHANLENLLRDHFASYPGRGPLFTLQCRKRLAAVYRSASRALSAQGDSAGAWRYGLKAVTCFPLDAKNIASLGYCALRR